MDTSDIIVGDGKITVMDIENSNGDAVSMTDGYGLNVVTLFDSAKVIGYDISPERV
jgi:hypothetical protein